MSKYRSDWDEGYDDYSTVAHMEDPGSWERSPRPSYSDIVDTINMRQRTLYNKEKVDEGASSRNFPSFDDWKNSPRAIRRTQAEKRSAWEPLGDKPADFELEDYLKAILSRSAFAEKFR